jgi:hypothetical protein
MDSKRDDEGQLEQQYVGSEDSVESYPRMLSNQTSDVVDMLGVSDSETNYVDGQQYGQEYGGQYGQDDSGSVA